MANVKIQSGIEVIESGRGKRVQMDTKNSWTTMRVQGPDTIKIIENGAYYRCECGVDAFLRNAVTSKTTCKHCNKDHSAVASRVEIVGRGKFELFDIPELSGGAISGSKANQDLDYQPMSTPVTLKGGLILLGLVLSVLGALYVAIMYL